MNNKIYYRVDLYWKDEEDQIISGYIIKQGDYIEPVTPEEEIEDNNIFYYVED